MLRLGKFSLFSLSAFLLSTSVVRAEGGQDKALDLKARIFSREETVHAKSMPIELKVIISNPIARVIAQENRRAAKDQLQKMPVVPLGTEKSPISSLLAISCQSSDGKSVPMKSHLLTSLPTSAQLDDKEAIVAVYFVDGDQFGDGQYKFTASLRNANKPLTASAECDLQPSLAALPEKEQEKRLLACGRLMLLDKKFDQALAYAGKATEQNPISVGADELKGDVYVEEKKLDLAVKSYKKGLEDFEKNFGEHGKTPNREIETPASLLSKLQALPKGSGGWLTP